MALRYCMKVKVTDDALARLTLERASHRAVFDACLGAKLPDGVRFLRFSDLTWYRSRDDGTLAEAPTSLIAQLAFDTVDIARTFLDARDDREASVATAFGRDPRIGIADAWLPTGSDGGLFGNRAQAHALIGADALNGTPRGEGVNVVIVDMGLVASQLRRDKADLGARKTADQRVHGWSRYDLVKDAAGGLRRVYQNAGGGWRREDASLPGPKSPYEFRAHAHMIARNVLALAPEARIWDVPLVDDDRVPPAISTATRLFNRIREFKMAGKGRVWREDHEGQDDENLEQWRKQPWVIVNAWGVFDTSADRAGMIDRNGCEYGDDPDHFLLNDLPELEKAGIDVVFCAGNCGDPWADWRCGPTDRGPGRGITGVNAHPSVLTVGAVRVDGLPVAQSSQGPGRLHGKWWARGYPQPVRALEKPDLCAPSHFREGFDGALASRGTSAAAGVAAGVIAALRSVPHYGALPPWQLRGALRRGAGANWDPRLGYGIINIPRAMAALDELVAAHP